MILKKKSSKDAYSIKETCERLSLGRNTVSELLNSGELHGKKIGRKWIIPAFAIRDFLNA